ncbi:sigma-70 family RNA polymerase sigma factor [Marinobacterium jannaschii]|uniref:sigma-70 family RNA polymerase sigma factor n=1 Tax=Marinobacterium jannaschii TaxID=64970 RepID=UPI000A74A313|nr:sigma-70 family RNA polymerase sigma factor [Marinobacterium jannaschii]
MGKDNNEAGDDVNRVVENSALKVARESGEMQQQWSAKLVVLGERKDRAVFAELFSHFAPRLKSYVIRLGLPDAAAEEVVQEAMLSVWRKAHLYRPEKAAASTWIFTLARNLCIDRMRKDRYPMCELPEEEPDPSERHAGTDSLVADRISAALSRLPEAQAQVVYLSFYEGRSHSEISERLGVPLGSVKSRMRLAFDKLRELWGDEA